MRTNIDIDDELMKTAMREGGLSTKKATVEQALQEFVTRRKQVKALEGLRGLGWEGDLDEMRNDWTEDTDWGLKMTGE